MGSIGGKGEGQWEGEVGRSLGWASLRVQAVPGSRPGLQVGGIQGGVRAGGGALSSEAPEGSGLDRPTAVGEAQIVRGVPA